MHVTQAESIQQCLPGQNKVRRGLCARHLFIAVHESMTTQPRLADIVIRRLPVIEHDELVHAGGQGYIRSGPS